MLTRMAALLLGSHGDVAYVIRIMLNIVGQNWLKALKTGVGGGLAFFIRPCIKPFT